jgi:hypothetical protein
VAHFVSATGRCAVGIKTCPATCQRIKGPPRRLRGVRGKMQTQWTTFQLQQRCQRVFDELEVLPRLGLDEYSSTRAIVHRILCARPAHRGMSHRTCVSRRFCSGHCVKPRSTMVRSVGQVQRSGCSLCHCRGKMQEAVGRVPVTAVQISYIRSLKLPV